MAATDPAARLTAEAEEARLGTRGGKIQISSPDEVRPKNYYVIKFFKASKNLQLMGAATLMSGGPF